MLKDEIILNHSKIFFRENGIIEVILKESSKIGKDECAEIIAVYKNLLGNKKYPMLHIVEDYVTIDKTARDYSASAEGLQFSKAEAYVFNSLAHKIIANFYMKMNKPLIPTKFFNNKKDAEEWLLEFL